MGLPLSRKTIIDRCTRLVYQDYLQDPRPENMPILGDLLRAASQTERAGGPEYRYCP